MRIKIFLFLFLFSCGNEEIIPVEEPSAFRGIKSISYNNVYVDVVIDKPAKKDLDVILVFHGTVQFDSMILNAANNTLEKFKEILDNKDMMIVSVAYPQEKILFGDNIVQAEAALLWLKNKAGEELGATIKKIFLGGHSQGGYVVTRLNTMHKTNGVIANAPGPLNLVYRCNLEENGQIPAGAVCTKLRNEYGTTLTNPDAYFNRSLLNFTDGYTSDILFVQGLNDAPVQMYSWPVFKQEITDCTDCQGRLFVEIPGGEHASLFSSPIAKTEFNAFINNR